MDTVPTNLEHNPIVVINGYNKFDAMYAENSDAKGLSIGRAQWSEDDSYKELSLKVWRHTGEKWSRQSEELPIHRCIDLNLLFIGALLHNPKAHFDAISLHETIVDDAHFSFIMEYYKTNEHYLRPRLEELQDKINRFLTGEISGNQLKKGE